MDRINFLVSYCRLNVCSNISRALIFAGERKDLPIFQNFEEMPPLRLTLITSLHKAISISQVSHSNLHQSNESMNTRLMISKFSSISMSSTKMNVVILL